MVERSDLADVQAAARKSTRIRRQHRGSSGAQHLRRGGQVPEEIPGDETEIRDERIPRVRDCKAIQDLGGSLHQVHVKLVVLAAIRTIGAGHHYHCLGVTPPAATAASIQQRGTPRSATRPHSQATRSCGQQRKEEEWKHRPDGAVADGDHSAGFVGYNGERMTGGSGVEEHFGGAVALGVVNSFGMKIMLAGLTWFIIGSAIAGLVQILGRREEDIKE